MSFEVEEHGAIFDMTMAIQRIRQGSYPILDPATFPTRSMVRPHLHGHKDDIPIYCKIL